MFLGVGGRRGERERERQIEIGLLSMMHRRVVLEGVEEGRVQ